VERKNIEAIIEILAELVLFDGFKWVAVRGLDDADVDLDLLASTDAAEFILFQHS